MDGVGEAAWNMAVDEALLNAVAANLSPPTVRLYRWTGCAITLGRFQNVARTMNMDVCRQHNIPIVRRITGGRGILHGNDLTIGITAPISALGLKVRYPTTVQIYEHTSRWFIGALSKMGIDARSGDCMRIRGQERYGNCFDIVSRADVVECGSGRKVLGSALFRRGEAMLQQISIPLKAGVGFSNTDKVAREVFQSGSDVLKVDAVGVVEDRGDRLSHSLDVGKLQEYIFEELECTYHEVQICTSATVAERIDAEKLVRLRYVQEAWNHEGNYLPPTVN